MPKKQKTYPLNMYPASYNALAAICKFRGLTIKEGLTLAIELFIVKESKMLIQGITQTVGKIEEKQQQQQ